MSFGQILAPHSLQIRASRAQDGLTCFFVRAGPNVSVSGCISYGAFRIISAPHHITRMCIKEGRAYCWIDTQRFLTTVLSLVSNTTYTDRIIGVCIDDIPNCAAEPPCSLSVAC